MLKVEVINLISLYIYIYEWIDNTSIKLINLVFEGVLISRIH